jgi:hypothetical protein
LCHTRQNCLIAIKTVGYICRSGDASAFRQNTVRRFAAGLPPARSDFRLRSLLRGGQADTIETRSTGQQPG